MCPDTQWMCFDTFVLVSSECVLTHWSSVTVSWHLDTQWMCSDILVFSDIGPLWSTSGRLVLSECHHLGSQSSPWSAVNVIILVLDERHHLGPHWISSPWSSVTTLVLSECHHLGPWWISSPWSSVITLVLSNYHHLGPQWKCPDTLVLSHHVGPQWLSSPWSSVNVYWHLGPQWLCTVIATYHRIILMMSFRCCYQRHCSVNKT